MTGSSRRGRPTGSTRYASTDYEILFEIAELVTDAKPPIPPTTAMRKLGHHGSSAHRRLQRKWKMMGDDLQIKVRERRRKEASQSVPVHSGSSYDYGGSSLGLSNSFDALNSAHTAIERLRREQALVEPPVNDLMRIMAERQRMQDLIDPPCSRMMREMMERERRLQDMINPPYLRALGFGW